VSGNVLERFVSTEEFFAAGKPGKVRGCHVVELQAVVIKLFFFLVTKVNKISCRLYTREAY
jgi:hypothetical protein